MGGWTPISLCCIQGPGITVILDTSSLGIKLGLALPVLPGVEMLPNASVSVLAFLSVFLSVG